MVHPPEGDLRLVGGGSTARGIVQMIITGRWATIQDTSSWGFHEARIACRQLGWSTGTPVRNAGAKWGSQRDPVFNSSYWGCDWSSSDRLYGCNRYEGFNKWLEDGGGFNATAGVECRNGRCASQPLCYCTFGDT